MATTTITLDDDVKRETTEILNSLGMTLSGYFNLAARQLCIKRRVPFEIEAPDPLPNELTRKAMIEAFKSDPNIEKIKFDCEAGGFFCYCNDLFLLMNFGSRFKALVDDQEAFTKVVSNGIKAYEKQRDEFAKIEFKILGRLTRNPDSNFMIRTVQGDVRLTPGDIKGLLDGSVDTIRVGGQHIKAEDFLMQDAYHIQPALFDRNTYQLITNEAKELQEHQSEDEDQSFQNTQQMM